MSDDNVRYLQEHYRQQAEAVEKAKFGGGGPPGGGDMDARIAALEKSLPEIKESLVRIETMLGSFEKNVFPNLATKADLITETSGTGLAVANFRTDITRVEGSMIKWFIGTAIVLSGGVGAIAFGLARAITH